MNSNSFGTPSRPRPWRRASDGVVAGVCTGAARQLDMPVWAVRLGWLVAVLCFGTGLFFYVAFWIALPREDDPDDGLRSRFLGVCARIGRRGDADVGLARLIALALLFLSGGSALVGYLVLWFLLPDNPSSTMSASAKRPS